MGENRQRYKLAVYLSVALLGLILFLLGAVVIQDEILKSVILGLAVEISGVVVIFAVLEAIFQLDTGKDWDQQQARALRDEIDDLSSELLQRVEQKLANEFAESHKCLRQIAEDLANEVSSQVKTTIDQELEPLRNEVPSPTLLKETGITPQLEIMEYLNKPLTISSASRNPFRVDSSDFLGWKQCTVLLGVNVPEQGQGLRDAPNYRYLLAHHTGKLSVGSHRTRNLFALRYSPNNQWELTFRNERGQGRNETLAIEDDLEVGWHQFGIAWNPTRLVFFIDCGEGGQKWMSRRFWSYWPEKIHNRVVIGAWFDEEPYEDSYCETEIWQLWIHGSFLELSDQVVVEHLTLLKNKLPPLKKEQSE